MEAQMVDGMEQPKRKRGGQPGPRSEAFRQMRSEIMVDYHASMTPEQKAERSAKLSAAAQLRPNRPQTDETRAKLAAQARERYGEPSPARARMSERQREKRAAARAARLAAQSGEAPSAPTVSPAQPDNSAWEQAGFVKPDNAAWEQAGFQPANPRLQQRQWGRAGL